MVSYNQVVAIPGSDMEDDGNKHLDESDDVLSIVGSVHDLCHKFHVYTLLTGSFDRNSLPTNQSNNQQDEMMCR